MATRQQAEDVGILAMEVYFPSTYVSQADLEAYDGVDAGKYTIGLGQSNMAFVGDREDINSICLTAVNNLLHKYDVPLESIGRIEVGTETIIDKSKSVKTEIMRLFQDAGHTDIEGADTTNACYGGTNALLNSIAWVESSAWDGRYALCVAADIAVYEKGNARPTGGVGAVAMLIGPNAPLVLERGLRASHMEHAYDFYKPNLSSEFPVVDGAFSTKCYTRAIDTCYARFVNKGKLLHNRNINVTGAMDYAVFHSPFNKMVQKSFSRLFFNDLRLGTNPAFFEGLEAKDKLDQFKKMPLEETYSSKDIEKFFGDLSKEEYKTRVAPGTTLQKELGNSYTASLYTGLLSLVSNVGEGLNSKAINMFSYGSGLCATMFMLRGIARPGGKFSLGGIQRAVNLPARLAARKKVSPQEFTDTLKLRESAYGRNSYTPTSSTEDLQKGTFFLEHVDSKWRRTYSIKN